VAAHLNPVPIFGAGEGLLKADQGGRWQSRGSSLARDHISNYRGVSAHGNNTLDLNQHARPDSSARLKPGLHDPNATAAVLDEYEIRPGIHPRNLSFQARRWMLGNAFLIQTTHLVCQMHFCPVRGSCI